MMIYNIVFLSGGMTFGVYLALVLTKKLAEGTGLVVAVVVLALYMVSTAVISYQGSSYHAKRGMVLCPPLPDLLRSAVVFFLWGLTAPLSMFFFSKWIQREELR